MNDSIRGLEPKELWNYFADLNAVPRPSKKEEKVIEFIKSFGLSLNLPTQVDEVGNIIIKKPATTGMENRQTVVLQSHIDMVHQKNADTEFDFEKQGIEMYIDGDCVKARGTTLGADNGIGVAAIMAVLASTEIEHPPIEGLFTIDEETGMTGAKGLKGGVLDGTILLNLDTEDDDELTIGCAGGIDVTWTGKYRLENDVNNNSFRISIKGLTGGHSGADIHLGRANANKLMNRLLWILANEYNINIATIEGGSLRNAIPRESFAEFTVADKYKNEVINALNEFNTTVKTEYNFTDPNLTVQIEEIDTISQVIESDFQYKLLRSIYACPNGIYRMTPEIPGLVQSSNNIAKVEVKNGHYSVKCLTRSSLDSEKKDLTNAIKSAFELTGGSLSFSGEYPGWEPKPDAPIIKLMSDLYKELFDEPVNVYAVHAGLECGIIGRNYPKMQMISFGPNIYGAHSPDERAQISSVKKFWKYFLEVLKRIP